MIDGNRTETVDHNQTITIHGSRTETVDENESITIGGARFRKREQRREYHDLRRPNRECGQRSVDYDWRNSDGECGQRRERDGRWRADDLDWQERLAYRWPRSTDHSRQLNHNYDGIGFDLDEVRRDDFDLGQESNPLTVNSTSDSVGSPLGILSLHQAVTIATELAERVAAGPESGATEVTTPPRPGRRHGPE